MEIIIKEKAVFCNIGSTWLNLAHAQSIVQNGDRVSILWADGRIQGFTPAESKKIIQTLQEYSKK
ncbi:hypothetical protein [Floridanema evergladense]|uniref:Uncharacterized protein n=1 Tax=Floridaenema evergladense BLCC-F167 TaxID=3153639 RepID=A0ABV4WEG3_9CYAN